MKLLLSQGMSLPYFYCSNSLPNPTAWESEWLHGAWLLVGVQPRQMCLKVISLFSHVALMLFCFATPCCVWPLDVWGFFSLLV